MLSFFQRQREVNRQRTDQATQRSRLQWFGRIHSLLRSSKLDETVWEELEEILISSDVGVATSLRLISELKAQVRLERIDDADTAFARLKAALVHELESAADPTAWLDAPNPSSPYVILMVGVNGVGKTTSIAKLAHHFRNEGKKVILGAADTFRAAAEEQLEILGDRAGVEVISHQPGADPGAVAYDAYQAGKARGADVLIVDTAGRLHTRSNLMAELQKVRRVINRLDDTAPHQVILTLDATTGLNGLNQAKAFQDAVGCTGIFLAKLDGTARGGIVLAIKQELQLPILFIGAGETLDDLAPFDPAQFVDALLSPVS